MQVFENKEFGRIEVLMMDDKPYFPATDCAIMLGYKTPRHAITRHCKGGHLWARGYFCSTVGSVTKETIQECLLPYHRSSPVEYFVRRS